LSFEQAASIPLCYATAAVALFLGGVTGLNLKRPSFSADSHHGGEPVLVWGGSSSVGSFAVQLLTHAGYKVISTASSHNHDYVRSLGAVAVIDYKDADVVAQIKKAAGGPIKYAYDAISEHGSVEKSIEVVEEGGSIRLVLPPAPAPEDVKKKVEVLATSVVFLLQNQDFARWAFHDYLEKALEKGHIVTQKIEVIPGWIDGIQNLLDIHKKGVSAKKLVVSKQ